MTTMSDTDLWKRLAAPLPVETIAWRQDGRPIFRDGKHYARFVAYVEANTVRERLDAVCGGEWDLMIELLPVFGGMESDEPTCSFKARLQILGVIREDVGTGRDYKAAATDAFKRAAVRFGIANELYDYEQNWVQVDSDSKYAKPVEDPNAAYARVLRRLAKQQTQRDGTPAGMKLLADKAEQQQQQQQQQQPPPQPKTAMPRSAPVEPTDDVPVDEPACPNCGGRMWDNRLTKRNPKAPDYKCRNYNCEGVIWPPKTARAPVPMPPQLARDPEPEEEDGMPAGLFDGDDDDLPF
jgi:hypothetical protein